LPDGIGLVVVGRPHGDDYLEVLRSLADGKDVEFVLDADDEQIRQYYRTARGVVLPSVYEDYYGNGVLAPELMGLTLLEGMACGTPALCSNVGALPEYVVNGETGFIYASLDELAHFLRRLAADDDLVASMGKRARQAVLQEYDLLVAGDRLAEIYGRILIENI
jgi:glycosyltransferase involved in cell wall biosynthesis